MLAAGVPVGLGTDCVTHNLFSVMLSVLQHHNIMPRALRGLDPRTIFELATAGGARVLGLGDEVGALEPGMRADIITFDLRRNSSLFPLDRDSLFWALASNGAGSETCDVLVDGAFVRRDGAFVSLDEEAIIGRARSCAPSSPTIMLPRRSGSAVPPRTSRVLGLASSEVRADLRGPSPRVHLDTG